MPTARSAGRWHHTHSDVPVGSPSTNSTTSSSICPSAAIWLPHPSAARQTQSDGQQGPACWSETAGGAPPRNSPSGPAQPFRCLDQRLVGVPPPELPQPAEEVGAQPTPPPASHMPPPSPRTCPGRTAAIILCKVTLESAGVGEGGAPASPRASNYPSSQVCLSTWPLHQLPQLPGSCRLLLVHCCNLPQHLCQQSHWPLLLLWFRYPPAGYTEVDWAPV